MATFKHPVYYAVVDEGIPDLALWLMVDDTLLTGSAYIYAMTVRNSADTADLFTKTTGFTGQLGTGDGSAKADVPNVIVSWDHAAETGLLTAGSSHKATLKYTRLSDNKVGYYPFVIRGVAQEG